MMGKSQGFSDNQMISARQAAWILFLNILAAGLFWLPSRLSGRGFTDMLIGGITVLTIVFLYYTASFLWLRQRKGSKKLVNILRLFFLIYYLAALVYGVRFFNQVMDSLIPGGYSYPIPIIFLLAVAIYSAGKGIEVRGRMAELLGWLVCIPFLVLLGAGYLQAMRQGLVSEDLFEWRDLIGEGTGFVSDGLLLNIGMSGWFFLLGDHPVLLWQRMNTSKKVFPVLLWGLAGGCLIVLLALVLTGIFFTPEGMAAEAQPFGILLQMIRFPGNFISRYDVFFIMLWMLSFFIFVSGMLLEAAEMAAGFMAGKLSSGKRRQLTLWLGLLVLLMVGLVQQWGDFNDVFEKWMLLAGVPVCILIIPVSVWKWRKSGG